jgi:hypothetical protein
MHPPHPQAKSQLGLGDVEEAVDEDSSAGLQVDLLAEVDGIQLQDPG